ncbi:hypothetical protein GCM10010345_86690 [Streptomyces canarius]|uniref:Uncharacterized protein n=1 Tax=Streptomyces canarius TaxID=285453 RepID=A0ABQ3DBF5_9ACTN|nr:hypothetical protein GCM10010345_86690 [Streptomyces canarius]
MTFAERVPGLTRGSGRRTERLRSTPVSVGLALAVRAGARMTGAFKVPVSRNTPGEADRLAAGPATSVSTALTRARCRLLPVPGNV